LRRIKTMANWVEGTFRARGPKENIKKFLMQGLSPISRMGKEDKIKKELEENDDYFSVTFKRVDAGEEKNVELLHISGTPRHFINVEDYIDTYKNEKGEFYIVESFKSAWSIDMDKIVEIAKKYKIDIRVNGYEKGMEFEQLFEVSRNGEVKCESFIQYADYTWECPMPLLGG
jgi:hypothetical protein